MAYYGIVGPKNLPKDVVAKINAAVRKAVQDPNVKKRIEKAAPSSWPTPPKPLPSRWPKAGRLQERGAKKI
jgi:hypothetical protein